MSKYYCFWVDAGDGAVMSIPDPKTFYDGGPAWQMRYGNPNAVRYEVASLLESYDYLLGSDINNTEAVKILRIMRNARALRT